MTKWHKFMMTLEEGFYKKLKLKSKQLGYLSMQELIRGVLREKFEKSELERFGEKIERKIKKIV